MNEGSSFIFRLRIQHYVITYRAFKELYTYIIMPKTLSYSCI